MSAWRPTPACRWSRTRAARRYVPRSARGSRSRCCRAPTLSRRPSSPPVCRELTKLHEEIARGTAADLAERFASAPKGEIALVLEPLAADGAAPAEIEAALAELRERGLGAKDAARLVAGLTGRSARDLYRP